MTNLFKRVACFTDIHFGLKSNSQTHNQDCEDFVDWFIETAKKEGAETCIFLGDWHHNRNSINLITLDTSMRCLEKLGAAFEQFFWFPGNHDLFYKDKRDIHSSAFGRHIPGVTVVDRVTTIKDVTLVPWLVGDEWKTISKVKSKYMFGHFELPAFYMNAMVQMPDHGDVSDNDLAGFEKVFSGHFHKRQARNNIWYIGNAFPHNYADAGDDQRGMMILEWGEEPEFQAWPGQPLYRVYKLSDILDNPEGLLLPKSSVRVHLDIDISYEEANFIRETLIPKHNIREMSLIPMKLDQHSQDLAPGEVSFESVDQIIIDQLAAIESEFFDPKVLLEIYRNL